MLLEVKMSSRNSVEANLFKLIGFLIELPYIYEDFKNIKTTTMNEPLKTLATFIFSLRAYMTKARLESEGIEVFLMNENFRYGAHVNLEEGIQLKVKANDYERAKMILAEISSEFLDGDEEQKPEIKKILVPIDFSSVTLKTCIFAIELAKQYKAQVTMFHVYYLPSIDAVLLNDTSIHNLSINEQLLNIQKNAEIKMNDLISNLNDRNYDHTHISYEFAKGFADDEILSFADSFKPDLIIMGNSSRKGRSRKLYGSITSEVVENVKIPVIVIPDNSQRQTPSNIQKVAYVSNFDQSDIRAVHKLLYLVSPFNVTVDLVHLSDANDDENLNLEKNKLQKIINNEFLGTTINLQLITGKDVMIKLQEFLEFNSIDLMSIQAQKRNFFSRLFRSSLSDKLMLNTSIPFLVFH